MALKYAKDVGYIQGYRSLSREQKSAETIKKLLKSGYLLLVVLTKVNRKKTESDGVLTRGIGLGSFAHSVCACNIDQDGMVQFVNSRGANWGRSGYFSAPDEELNHCISQAYVVLDTDDKEKMDQLLYKKRLSDAVQIISKQRKYGTEEEKKAMNFANSMLRKVCFQQNHQWNMAKQQVLDFVQKNF